jgi:hypothetical protein
MKADVAKYHVPHNAMGDIVKRHAYHAKYRGITGN